MKYAKYITDTEIQIPSQEDYLEDGVTLKTPEEWLEFVEQSEPTDTSVFKSYVVKYALVSENFLGNTRKIIQTWTPVYFEPEGRVAKLNGKNLVFPKKNETVNGALIMNYPNQPNSRKIQDGWMLIEETVYPNDGNRYRETGILIDDPVYGHKIKVVWEVVAPMPEMPFDISKIKLKRALETIGKWEEFKAILGQDPSVAEEFDLAVTLVSNDPLVLLMSQICIQQFGLTEEQIKTILRSCQSDI